MSHANFPDRLLIDPAVDPRGRQAVEQLLADDLCQAVEYRQSTTSTNSLAMQDLLSTPPSVQGYPKLFLSDEQTAGRGRHGRRWISSNGTLTFSLVIRRPEARPGLSQLVPLAVGVGLARFLEFEFAPIRTKLKWPNDLHVAGGKVAGILMETSSTFPDRLVVGVGINVGEAPKLDSLVETQAARGLSSVLGRGLHRYELLYGIVSHILQSIEETESESDQLIQAFRDRCLLSGQVVGFQQGDVFCEGHCGGITEQGALIIETATGTRNLQSGEANLIRSRNSRTK